MAEGARQYRKVLRTTKGAGHPPHYVTVADDQAQAEYVVARILETRESGVPLKRQAVLFRSSHHSDTLELELTRRNIPFVKYGGLKFLEAAHVKDLLAVLRWADNPKNRIAAFRALQLLPGMGPSTAEQFVARFERSGFSWNAFRDFTSRPSSARRGVGSVCRADGRPRRDRGAVAGTGRPHARVVRAASRADLRVGAGASGRSDSARAAGAAVRHARSVSCRAGAGSSGRHRRSVGHAVSRRGLSGAVDRPLGEGPGVGRRLHPERRRRQFPIGVLDGQAGSD